MRSSVKVEGRRRLRSVSSVVQGAADEWENTTCTANSSHRFSAISVVPPQSKLKVNDPGDVYEQEADRVADAVTQGVAISAAVSTESPHAQRKPRRKCLECEEEDRKRKEEPGPIVRRKCAACAALEAEDDDVSERVDELLRVDAGQPLDPPTRGFMEHHIGHNFADVRIHDSVAAAASARSLGSRAYTLGSDIVMGEGEYKPQTSDGRRLLAHELTHVVQQGHASPRSESEGRQGVSQSTPVGDQISGGRRPQSSGGLSG